ncbi:hypothetical protein [Microbacterium schleiferi]|uniref:hypothetical protein n=1 Tax=Microbacterium schleiferi TaxID=69362 RepID=UPI001D1799EE|nr:hypothetical protein [Microbacterium schleiferi]MCC4267158.1 hypothetical protein [Microbacterium schleiferi]
MSHAGEGLTSPLTWAPLASGAALLALFAVVELRGAHPFFPMQLFRNPGFLAAIGMGIAFNLAQAVGILQLANIWQYVYGFSTVEVSLGQLPVTVISVAASIYIGRRLSAGFSPATAILISGGATRTHERSRPARSSQKGVKFAQLSRHPANFVRFCEPRGRWRRARPA